MKIPTCPGDSECYACDTLCGICDSSCSLEYCYIANTLTVFFFGCVMIALSIRSVQFFIYSPKPTWNFKKIIYICGIVVCILRISRWSLLLGKVNMPLVLDRILYWYGSGLIIAMYSLLIAFWANLCSKDMVVFSWLGGRMKKIFIGWTLILFGIWTCFAVIERYLHDNIGVVLSANATGLFLLLSVTIATTVEGYKVRKVLIASTTKREITERDRKLVKTITSLVTTISIGFICFFLLVAAATVVRLKVSAEFNLYQSIQLLYRALELTALVLICWPIKKYRDKQLSALPVYSKQSSSNAFSGTDLTLRSPGDPPRTGSSSSSSTKDDIDL